MPARIVVTSYKGGSRVALIGVSGKELLASQVFHEPRAKGATLRSLKGLLGDSVAIEDHTLATKRPLSKTTAPESAVKNGTKNDGVATDGAEAPARASGRRSARTSTAASGRRSTTRRTTRRVRAAASSR